MSQLPIIEQLRQLPSKLMRLLNLSKIDQHDSLTFLYKNYHIQPSEVITILIILVTLIIMLLDGCNIISAVFCFLLPLLRCLKELGEEQAKNGSNFVKLNQSQQNSRLTDQQFSQILSANRTQYSTVKIYVMYFILYGVVEVLSPLMVWLIGSISWLILRCFFTAGMLSKNGAGISKLLGLSKFEEKEEGGSRRNALLYER